MICVDGEQHVYICTECGYMHQFEADGPTENDWSFCPHCGKQL